MFRRLQSSEGVFEMVLDNEALIALGFVGLLLAVTGGLFWFVLSRKD